jgi:hypothetical protein
MGHPIFRRIEHCDSGDQGTNQYQRFARHDEYCFTRTPHRTHAPIGWECAVSQKIDDKKERQFLQKILEKLTIPEGMDIIIRTDEEGKQICYFICDLDMLLQTWQAI